MTLLIRSFLLSAISWTLCIGVAHAGTVGTWSNEYDFQTDADGAFTITYKSKNYNLSISPYTTLDDQIWYYNANLTSQSSSSIGSSIERQYGLLSGSLASAGKCDASGCTTGASMDPAASTGGGTVSTFTSTSPFDYLGVHIGNGELFFAWANPVTSVTFAGLPTASISNYQAFIGPVVATPVPGAALLFASAVLVGGGLTRRSALRRTFA